MEPGCPSTGGPWLRAGQESFCGDEETLILPLAEEHLTAAEWGQLGGRFADEVPKDKLLFFLGAMLEDATPAERATMLGNPPMLAGWRGT